MSIDIATSPAHATLELISEIQEASPELRQQVMQLHQAPNNVLEKGRQGRARTAATRPTAGHGDDRRHGAVGCAARRSAAKATWP